MAVFPLHSMPTLPQADCPQPWAVDNSLAHCTCVPALIILQVLGITNYSRWDDASKMRQCFWQDAQTRVSGASTCGACALLSPRSPVALLPACFLSASMALNSSIWSAHANRRMWTQEELSKLAQTRITRFAHVGVTDKLAESVTSAAVCVLCVCTCVCMCMCVWGGLCVLSMRTCVLFGTPHLPAPVNPLKEVVLGC